MSPQGVYPAADVCALGEQISSTFEGRHITLYPDDLSHGSGVTVVTKGRPVWFGEHAVGMPFVTQTAATNLIKQGAIDTEGIWCVDVDGQNDDGASAVTPGQQLYINTTTGVVSKISNQATQICLGYALGNVGSGSTERIAVKVHFDPSLDNAKRTYITVADGEYVYGKHHTSIFEGGKSTGLEYFDQQVGGVQTGFIHGWSSWLEVQTDFVGVGLMVVGEFAIYDGGGGSDISSSWVVLLQLQAILDANPATLNLFRVNIASPGGVITAVFQAANPGSLNYQGITTESDSPIGYIPFATIVGINGGNPVMIRVYADKD